MSRDRRAGWCVSVLSALIACLAIWACSSCSSDGDGNSPGPDSTPADGAPTDAKTDGAPMDGAKDGVPPPGDAPADAVTKGPRIDSFTATPPTLPAGGGSTTLAWAVTGAT